MSNLTQQLPILYELQEVDVQIKKLNERKKAIPIRIKKLADELEKFKKNLSVKQDELRNMQKELRLKNGILELQQAQLKKYLTQHKSVKTEKEYNSLEKEIKHIQKKNADIEDEILELLFSIDNATEELKDYQSKYDKEKAKYRDKNDELFLISKDLISQIEQWRKRRSSYYDKIDSQLLGRYNEWLTLRGKFLLAPVIGNTCSGCNLTVPPQTINEIRKGEELIYCGSCSRILYLPDEQ